MIMKLYYLSIIALLSLSNVSSSSEFDDDLRFAKLEAAVEWLEAQVSGLTTQNMAMEADLAVAEAELDVTQDMLQAVLARPSSAWTLTRTELVFASLTNIQLHQATPTYVETLPTPLPDNTKAVIISVFCRFWNTGSSHAYLSLDIQQQGNEDGGVTKLENKHFSVYANTFYYEVFVPWDSAISNQIVFDVTESYNTGINSSRGGNENSYTIKMVGYVTA